MDRTRIPLPLTGSVYPTRARACLTAACRLTSLVCLKRSRHGMTFSYSQREKGRNETQNVIDGDNNVQKWIRIWQMVGHKRTVTATPLVSGNSSRWKLSSSTLLMMIFTSVTRWRLLTSALVRLSTLTRAIIYRHTEQWHSILKHSNQCLTF